MYIKNELKHRSIGKEIGILSRAAHKYFQLQFKDFAIGHAQVMTLHFICRHDGISQFELAKHFNMDKSSVTSQLNKLEKNGYVIRIKDAKDSRGRKIFITPKTKIIEANLHEKFSAWSKILLKDFDTEEVDKIFFLLSKMKTNALLFIKKMKNNEEKK